MQKVTAKQLFKALKARGYTQEKIEAMVQEVTVKNPVINTRIKRDIEERLRKYGVCALYTTRSTGKILLVSDAHLTKHWAFPRRGVGSPLHPDHKVGPTHRKHGIIQSRVGRPRTIDHEAIKAAFAAGKTRVEVRKQFGISKTTAWELHQAYKREAHTNHALPTSVA